MRMLLVTLLACALATAALAHKHDDDDDDCEPPPVLTPATTTTTTAASSTTTTSLPGCAEYVPLPAPWYRVCRQRNGILRCNRWYMVPANETLP